LRAVLALFVACSMLLFAVSVTHAEPPPVLILDPDDPVQFDGAQMRFAPDVGDTLSDLAQRFTDGSLSASFADSAALLRPYQPLWGVVEIQSAAPDDGRPPADWVLASDIHGIVALDVVLIRLGAETEQLLAHDIRKPFVAKDYAVTRLVSAPFDLRPGERALVLVRMVLGASETLDLSLERGEAVREKAFVSGLSLAGFYAFLLSCLIIFAVFSGLMRDRVGLAYAALLTLGLVFVAYLDNFLFRWLYPAHPAVHLPFGIVFLLLIAATGFLTATLSLTRFGGGSWVLRPLVLLAGVALICIAAVGFLSPEIMAPVAYVLMVVMLAAHVFVVFQWDALGDLSRSLSRVVPLVALLGLGGVVVLTLARSQIGGLPIPWMIKGTYAALAIGIMTSLSAGLIDMRRAHAAALAREMAAVRKEADTARDLLEAERNHARMRDLADQRRLQMAGMSHDIRQPLGALRLSIEGIARDAPPETQADLREAFDYIQTLTATQLDDARNEALGEDQDRKPADTAEPSDPYPLSLVQEAVAQMFSDEAGAKGVELRIVPSSVLVNVPALPLMRIIANLVSNAVKYTPNGRVLVGVRRRKDHMQVQVLDTGTGMTDQELAQNAQAWTSGTDSTGHGLGLAICHSLAAQNGLDLTVTSRPGAGTVFTLSIPV
jgi:signal transduction histidine kinase